jgi:CBS domain containing-hemolysin-like protein
MIIFLYHNLVFLLSMTALLLCSALFSGTETALFSLTPENIRRLRSHDHAGFLIRVLHENPTALLSSILFGNLIVNILFFCTGAVAAGHWASAYGALGETIGGVIVLLLIILFGEIAPKAAGVSHPIAVLRVTGAPLSIWFRLSRPVCVLIDSFLRLFRMGSGQSSAETPMSVGELKELLDSVRHEPGFGAREKLMMEDIVNLSDVRVREIMVPRVLLFSKHLSASRDEIFSEAAAGEYSHVLVYENSEDELLGYIKIRDLFFDRMNRPLEEFICPLVFVPETKRADQLLKEMLSGDWALAAVVDEYGGLAGVVTTEDLFAEVVGDPESQSGLMQKIDENTYRLDGRLPIREWKELLTGMLPGHEVQSLAFDTLGGFVVSLLGRMPRSGDTISIRNLRLTVEAMQQRRIKTVLLHLNLLEEGS